MEVNEERQVVAPLALRAFSVWRQALDEVAEVVVRHAVPILYFGDLDAHLASPRRIVTVGLNPSHDEFPIEKPFRRFPRVARLELPDGSATEVDGYIQALNEYFERAPYRSWFSAFEPILHGMNASYYLGARNTAIHTDVCSPVATDPTWTGLTKEQQGKLAARGRPLWHDLVRVLRPDVLLVSVAKRYLADIEFERSETEREILSIERSPYPVTGQWLSVRPEKKTLLVFGGAAQVPFGTVKKQDKLRIGGRIADFLDE